MKKTLFTAFLSMLLLVIVTKAYSQTTKVSFTASTVDFPNPERGFYQQEEEFNVFDLNTLKSLRNGKRVNGTTVSVPITLVLRLYYLDKFKKSDLTNASLTTIENDFKIARDAGIKLILRFAYSNSASQNPREADKEQILKHIGQLKSLLTNYKDIIATVQMGFIGTWGENWYTTYFGTPDVAGLTSQNWRDRKSIFDALLLAVPTDRMVQVRAPQMKQKFVDGVDAPITSTAQNARIGLHNDCFLKSFDDEGTYKNYSTNKSDTTNLKKYLQSDVAKEDNVVVGGETCDIPNGTVLSKCSINGGQVENELKRFHFSFLNAGYSPTTYTKWMSCLPDISKKLGYRFTLIDATYTSSITTQNTINIQFSVRNDGYAALYNPRKIEFILKNVDTNIKYYATATVSDANPKKWQVDVKKTINETFCLGTIPNGTYDLFLNLPDPSSKLYSNPNYSIRLANDNVWDAATGYNKLTNQRITIRRSTSNCNSSYAKFSSASSLPVQAILNNNIPNTLPVIVEASERIVIYPNPTTGILFIQSNVSEPFQVSIFNNLGQLQITQKMVNGEIDLSSLSKGIYYLQCTINDKQLQWKVVKN